MFRLIAALLLIGVASCELTEGERAILQKSWGPYHTGNPTENGVKFFLAFIKTHPEVQAEFPKFAHVPLGELKDFPAFRDHATKIFHVVDDAIIKRNWEDVQKLSAFHKQLGKTDKSKYNQFRAAFMKEMNLNAEQTAVWNKALDLFFHHLFSKF